MMTEQATPPETDAKTEPQAQVEPPKVAAAATPTPTPATPQRSGRALAVLALMMAAAPLAGALALPSLAGLLILTAWNMSEPHRFRQNMGARGSDRFLFFMTLALTVLVDLSVAVGAGVAVGLALRLQRRNVPPTDWTPPDR